MDASTSQCVDFYGHILLRPSQNAHEWPVRAAQLGCINDGGFLDISFHAPRALVPDHVVHQICADYGASDAAWLQEDLAIFHAAKASNAVKQQLGLLVFPWVGQSPDLNPIENAWAELERRLRARPTAPKNKDELFATLSEEWDAIPASFLRRLVESIPRRVRDVIAAGGASTKS